MPDLPTLTVTAADGTERATLEGIRAERDRHVVDSDRGRFLVDRERWRSVADAINERSDRFRIDADGVTGWFGGRFRDTERGGQTVTVILDDYERDARDAEPTGGQALFENVADATVVTDALSRVPTLTAGTVNTVASGLSFSLANVSPANQIRDAAEPGGALVRYNADRTVDFEARPPVDGSEPELSTAAETLVGDPDVQDDNRNPPTQIIGLGAQGGPNQVRATAEVVANADREVYRRYENKDIQKQSRLQTIVDRLATEVANTGAKLDIECEAVGIDVRPGDPVDFVWPAEGIDTTLRVIEFTEVVGERGVRYDSLRVSNRWPEQGGTDKAIADLERFNRGYQGFIDRDNFRAVERQPVTAGTNATGEYPYPDDVEREDTAELTVRSIPYRAYSSGAADNANLTNIEQEAAGIQTTNLTAAGGFQVLDTFTVTSDPPISALYAAINFNADIGSLNYRLYDVTDDEYYPYNFGGNGVAINLTNSATGWATVQKDVSGHQFEWQASVTFDESVTHSWWFQTSGKHTHDPDPGLIDSFPDDPDSDANGEFLASNVDVIIDGTTVATDIGSGTFTATVDITGDLSPGVNDIELASDSLGLVSAYVQTELFRQGPEDP